MNNSYYFQSSLPVFLLFIIVILRCLLFIFLFCCIDVIYVYDTSTPYLNMERYVKECHESQQIKEAELHCCVHFMFLSVIQVYITYRDAVVSASCTRCCGLDCHSDGWPSYLRFLLLFADLLR